MDELTLKREARERAAKLRLGTDDPQCATCGFTAWQALENHHPAGRTYDPRTTFIECRNCHRILSDWQRDHPKQISDPPTFEESLAHFLLGMADMFSLLVGKLREFAEQLLQRAAQNSETAS